VRHHSTSMTNNHDRRPKMRFQDFLVFASIIGACFLFPVYLLIRDLWWARTTKKTDARAKQPPSVEELELQKQAELELKASETELIDALGHLIPPPPPRLLLSHFKVQQFLQQKTNRN
jgi:hypothetical protein